MIAGKHSWFGFALMIGVVYAAIGITFALPASNVPVWRLAAWVVSGLIYVFHIAYEHYRLNNSVRATALHAAGAAAIGAFGLAVAANIHELWRAPHYRPALAVALVAWPVLVVVPAFIVALAITYVLSLIRKSSFQKAA
jgi:hypothetical protein